MVLLSIARICFKSAPLKNLKGTETSGKHKACCLLRWKLCHRWGVGEGHRHWKTQANTHITSYLLDSGFAWVLGSFLFLDSFLVSFLASGSDGEGGLLPSGSVFGSSPLRYTCICWLWRGGGHMGHAQSVARHRRIKSKHTCTNKRKKKKDASNSKSKCIQTKIISKKKKKKGYKLA